jgi:nucleoside-diphosphate-sugar epimerase
VSDGDFARFLAEDFERIEALDAKPLQACRALNGQQLMLTGATGFFGKNLLALCAYLYRNGLRFEVTALSRNPQRFLLAQPWAAQQPWLNWVQGEVTGPWSAPGTHSLLLHAATDTHASAHQDLQAVFEHELAATRQVLAFASASGVQRLLLTGSGAQFGAIGPEHAAGIADDSALACQPLLPGSAYGEGKRVAELLATLHAKQQGTALVATRCFAFVGPGLDLQGHFAIGNFIADALAARPIRLKSAGLAQRSYLYGADLALWLLQLLLHAPPQTVLNVGSDEPLPVLQLAELVRDLLCPRLDVLAGAPRGDEPRSFYVPAIERARSLGLRPWTPLALAIQRTASWHQRSARAA